MTGNARFGGLLLVLAGLGPLGPRPRAPRGPRVYVGTREVAFTSFVMPTIRAPFPSTPIAELPW